MSWVATAIVGTGLVASYTGSKASGDAADAQADAAAQADDTQWKMYTQSRADQMPWLEAGQRALPELEEKVMAGPGNFLASPGYQFRMDEGVKALDRSASAGGDLLSGGQTKALTRYGQDYASNEYQNFLNQYYQSLTPYQSMAGVGQTTAFNMGAQGQNTANQVSQNQLYAGRAKAGGYINQANAWTQGIQGGMNALGSYYGAQQQQPYIPQNTQWGQPTSGQVNYNTLWNG